MLSNEKKYTPVLKHDSIQVILPYELFKVTDNNTGKLLWFEVTHKDPQNFEEYARRAFTTEEAARAYIISQLTHKESIHK